MSVIQVRGSLKPWLENDDSKLICVEFYSLRSDACKEIAYSYNILSRQYRQALFLRIDGDAYAEEMNNYGITELPTFLFFFCGEERDRMERPDKYLLEAKIQQYSQTTQNQPHTNTNEETDVVEENNSDELNDGRMEEEEGEGEGEETNGQSIWYDSFMSQRFPNKPHVLGSSKETPLTMPNSSSSLPQSGKMMGNEEMDNRNTKKEEEEEEEELEGSVPSLKFLRKSLEEMKFTPDIIDMVMKIDDSRDLSRLVQLATLIQEDSELTETQIASMSEWEQAERSLLHSKMRKVEVIRKKTRGDIARELRIQEAERQRQLDKTMEQERQRVMSQFYDDHRFKKPEKKTIPITNTKQAIILIDSIFSQSQFNIGRNALTYILKILQNTSQPDPKYRSIRQDSKVMKETIALATGAIPLLKVIYQSLSIFNTHIQCRYVMENRDDMLVDGIIAAIQKRLNPLARRL